jgi:proton glutamate symport protein
MSSEAPVEKPRWRGSLLTWSLAALAAGLGLGLLGHASGHPAFGVLAEVVKPIGDLWMAALLAVVLPLVLTQVLDAVVGARGAESVGRLGVKAVVLYLVMLAAAGLFTLLLAPPIIAGYRVDAASIASLHATLPAGEVEAPAPGAGSFGKWIGGLLPRNVFEAAARGDILALLLFTVLFAAAVARLPEESRAPLARLFQGLARAM